MAGFTRAQNLTNFVRSLNEEGILDHNFNHLETIRNEGNNPAFIVHTLNSYFHDSKKSIGQLSRYMSETTINYTQVKDAAHHLKSCSSGIGGCRVVQACQELEIACVENNRDRCLESFERVNEEYGTFNENLRRICAIERAYLANEARRRGER